MIHEVFSRPEMATHIDATFHPVSVDLTHDQSSDQHFALRYDVTFLPTYLLLAPQGHELARLEGAVDLAHFKQWLDSAYEHWNSTPTVGR